MNKNTKLSKGLSKQGKLDDTYILMLWYIKGKDRKIKNKELMDEFGIDHHHKVTHRLKQLEKRWYLRQENLIYKVYDKPVWNLLNIPVYSESQIIRMTQRWIKPRSSYIVNR